LEWITSDAGITAGPLFYVLIMFLFLTDSLARCSRDVFIQSPEIYGETDFYEGPAEEPLSSVWPAKEKVSGKAGISTFTSCCSPVSGRKRGIVHRFRLCSC